MYKYTVHIYTKKKWCSHTHTHIWCGCVTWFIVYTCIVCTVCTGGTHSTQPCLHNTWTKKKKSFIMKIDILKDNILSGHQRCQLFSFSSWTVTKISAENA